MGLTSVAVPDSCSPCLYDVHDPTALEGTFSLYIVSVDTVQGSFSYACSVNLHGVEAM